MIIAESVAPRIGTFSPAATRPADMNYLERGSEEGEDGRRLTDTGVLSEGQHLPVFHEDRGVPILPAAVEGYGDGGEAWAALEGKDQSGGIQFTLYSHTWHDSGVVYFTDQEGNELAQALEFQGLREVFYELVAREEWVIEDFEDPVIDAFYKAADEALSAEVK